MPEIKVQKTIYELLQEIRLDISKAELKKSGHNGFQNFDYFELKDFLPTATKLFNDKGICPIFNIVFENGIEYATLTLVKGNEMVVFKSPTAEPSGNNPIQSLGSKITYMRRYLYLSCLDLVENDSVDASDNSKVTEPKATKNQIEIILNSYDSENLQKMKDYYKIKDLSELTAKQASFVINKKQKENK